MPKRTPITRVLPVVGCLLAGLLAWFMPLQDHDGMEGFFDKLYLIAGESLLHRLPLVGHSYYHFQNADLLGANPFFHLPASDILAALLYSHWMIPPRVLQGISVLIVALLLLALEGMLSDEFILGLTSAAAVTFYHWGYLGGYPDGVFSFYVLVVAGFLIRYVKTRSYSMALGLALAIGTSFLFRSPLALLPPALAVSTLAFGRDERSRRLKHAAILLIVPYLFTLPVLRANWKLQHQVIPFENGESSEIIIPGALGVVESLEGQCLALIPQPNDFTNKSVLFWASAEVLRHPVRYVSSCLLRAARIVQWSFPLLFLALFSIWVHRRKEEFLALGFLIFYYIGIHCLVTVQRRYLEPIQPLLILLACSLAGRLISMRSMRVGVPKGLPFSVLNGALAALLGLSLYAAYLTRQTGSATLAEAIQKKPNDWWLLQKRAEEHLRLGEVPEAIEDFSRSLGLKPHEVFLDSVGHEILGHEIEAQLATAEMFQGRLDRLWQVSFNERPKRKYDLRCSLGRAYAFLTLGRESEAEEEIRIAKRKWAATRYIRGPENTTRPDILSKLRSIGDFVQQVDGLLDEWPEAKRAPVKALLARVYPGSAPFNRAGGKKEAL